VVNVETFLVMIISTLKMKRNRSRQDLDDRQHSHEDNSEPGEHLDNLNQSHESLEQDPLEASVRTNAASKTYWTRIFSADDNPALFMNFSSNKPGIYCLNDDLQMHELLVQQSEHDHNEKATPVYDPKAFNDLYKPLECEDYRLEQEELLQYAELATTIRERLAERALEKDREFQLRNPNGVVTDKRIDTLIQKRFHSKAPHQRVQDPEVRKEYRSKQYKSTRKNLCDLTPSEIEAILRSVKVDFLTYKAAGDKHGVKSTLVKNIITNAKKDTGYVSKRREKLEGKVQLREVVAEHAQVQLATKQQILSVRGLAEAINNKKGLFLKPHFVKEILKVDLGLKYKAFKFGAIQANTQRCLVQRQQYAITMLKLLEGRKTVYNVDESTVDQLDFTRRHWRPKKYALEGLKPVTPRISLIACVGSDGTAFYSLTQVNTDHQVFCLYLTELAKRLTALDKDWRDNSVLLLDGAKYHTCEETLKHLAFLKMPVIFSGPYSYVSHQVPVLTEHFFPYSLQQLQNSSLPTSRGAS
jgi:hypothetical protein